jgi:hypothetical protein
MKGMHNIVAGFVVVTTMVTSVPQQAAAVCTTNDEVYILNHKIKRCWTRMFPNLYTVRAEAYRIGDDSYVCQRSYTYHGQPGDAEDMESIRYVFDSNGDNYLDCLQGVPPPEGEGGCEMPRDHEWEPPIE